MVVAAIAKVPKSITSSEIPERRPNLRILEVITLKALTAALQNPMLLNTVSVKACLEMYFTILSKHLARHYMHPMRKERPLFPPPWDFTFLWM